MGAPRANPLITTIIPTYRRPKLLKKAILSVLNQTYPHFQVLVCDNASGDETSEVVAALAEQDARIKYHCHAENIGAIANFNFGMQQVNTPFFSLLSDDNTLLPNFFAEAIAELRRNGEASLFAGQTIMVNEEGQPIRGSLDKWESGAVDPPAGLLHILEKGIPNWEGVLFRSELIQKVGLLNPSYSGAVDQDFMMRIAKRHMMYIFKKPCATFLCQESSWSNSRESAEVLSTFKKRLQPFLDDQELSHDIRRGIKRVLDLRVNRTIGHIVFCECLIEGQTEKTAQVLELVKTSKLSFKTQFILKLMKLVGRTKVLKRAILRSVELYTKCRRKYHNIKRKRRFGELTVNV